MDLSPDRSGERPTDPSPDPSSGHRPTDLPIPSADRAAASPNGPDRLPSGPIGPADWSMNDQSACPAELPIFTGRPTDRRPHRPIDRFDGRPTSDHPPHRPRREGHKAKQSRASGLAAGLLGIGQQTHATPGPPRVRGASRVVRVGAIFPFARTALNGSTTGHGLHSDV